MGDIGFHSFIHSLLFTIHAGRHLILVNDEPVDVFVFKVIKLLKR